MHTHQPTIHFDNIKSVFLTSLFPLAHLGKCFSIHCYRFHFRFILSSPQTRISFHPQCVCMDIFVCMLFYRTEKQLFFFSLQVKKAKKNFIQYSKTSRIFNLCTSVLLQRLLTANAFSSAKIHSEILVFFSILVEFFFFVQHCHLDSRIRQ